MDLKNFPSVFAVCFLLVSSNLQQKCEGTKLDSTALFYEDENFEGSRLVDNLIKKIIASSSVECNFKCLREDCCVSTNYKEPVSSNAGKENCELNYARASEKPDDFVKNDGSHYHEMMNPERVGNFCCLSPCPKGSTCDAQSKICDNDECAMDTHECDLNADCVNTVGSYNCQCRNGYSGNGKTCTDINECSQGTHTCDSNADCSNNAGSHSCRCRSGYSGNGKTCTDIDECSEGTHTCDSNADCSNTAGSYSCQCRTGYSGNGKTCTDIDECSEGTHTCHSNANCLNTVASYTCQCHNGYTGNGKTCTAYCGDPGSPSRGYRSGSSFTVGSTVNFKCSFSGEVLSGYPSSTCQANSTWSNRTPPRCGTYGLRLAGNSGYSGKGRIEVYHPKYDWGTVCDDKTPNGNISIDINVGNVVCRQLGYSGASAVYPGAHYGQGTNNTLLDNLNCSGSESRLWDCPHAGWNVENCGHHEDASVDCH